MFNFNFLKRSAAIQAPATRLHMIVYFSFETSQDELAYQGKDALKAKDVYSEFITKKSMVGSDIMYVDWYVDGERYK